MVEVGDVLEPLVPSLEVEVDFSQQTVIVQTNGLNQSFFLCEDCVFELAMELVATAYAIDLQSPIFLRFRCKPGPRREPVD